MLTPLKLVRRGLVTWIIEAAALWALHVLLPGVHIRNLQVDAMAVLLIGALNALVRPIVLLFAENLGLVVFLMLTLVLNAVMVSLVAWALPGFYVDSAWTAFVLAFGLAVLNTLVSGLLGINDDDSFYRNVTRWLERRRAPQTGIDEPGTIFIQVDGLAERIFRQALADGNLPTLQAWLARGTHRLTGWQCDVPSMTSSGQSGILYGNNANIPAFRWYEKEQHRLLVSNRPWDARTIEDRQSTDHALLRDHGSSVGNIFAGGAEHCVVTMSRLTTDTGRFVGRAQDLYDYFVSPYNLYRAIGAMIWEVVVEIYEAWRQRLRKDEPRVSRGGVYPLVRAVSTILLRDITTWMLVADMFGGRRVMYADYLGYDEVAHHSGPWSPDARRVLKKMEGQFRQLEHAARRAPRPYQFVVLSDHGQSTGATFRRRYGLTLDQLVHQLMGEQPNVRLASGRGEGLWQIRALLAEAGHVGGLVARGARLVGGAGIIPRPAADEDAEVVVCASGNLALVYFAQRAGRLTLEDIELSFPGLIAGLVQHPGIGFLMLDSEAEGPVVLSKHGRCDLKSGRCENGDPLRGLDPHTATLLQRLASYPNVGDIVVNSVWDLRTGEVAAFEELVGCHGGAGGLQTHPFLLYPAEWGDPPVPLCGAESVHAFLRQHVSASTGESETRQDGQMV